MKLPIALLLKSLPTKAVIAAILDFLDPYVAKKVAESTSLVDDKIYNAYLILKKELLK